MKLLSKIKVFPSQCQELTPLGPLCGGANPAAIVFLAIFKSKPLVYPKPSQCQELTPLGPLCGGANPAAIVFLAIFKP